MDTVLGGWPIWNNDHTKIIGWHGVNGTKIMQFNLEPFIEEYVEKAPFGVGTIREGRHFEHPTRKVCSVYSGPWPESHFVYTYLTCPLCDAPTESFSDCPGYGTKPNVMVCGNFYSDDTITGKFVSASACGNSDLYVCINPDCEWEWRTHNRRSEIGIAPSWKDHAEKYDPLGDDDDEV